MANLMLLQVSMEIRKLIHEDEQQIYFQNIGNENSLTIPSQKLEMQLLRSDEWAGRIYELYCETWECQQKPLIPQFIRGVCQHSIRILISARIGSVSSEVGREEKRTGRHGPEWVKSVTESFRRDMELLFHKWFQAAEIDAKTVEHMLAAVENPSAVDRVAIELISARTRMRVFDARTASVHAKIMALERALSTASRHELAAHRYKLMEQILERLKSDKTHFENRREKWQARLNSVLSRMAELRSLAKQQRSTETPAIAGRKRPHSKLAYRSEIKRVISLVLTTADDPTDLQVCRILDTQAAVDLPDSWRSDDNRSFERAFRDPRHHAKIEKMISKVRTDLRDIGIRQ